jgi:hypothetical protein
MCRWHRALCIAVFSVISACGSRPLPGGLAKAAKDAKSRGSKTATVRLDLDENGTEGPLDDHLRKDSIIMVALSDANPVQVTGVDAIRTWHSFRLLRVFAKRACQRFDDPCPTVPRELSIAVDQIAVPLLEGTAIVDGVAITMDSSESHVTFKPNQQYLMLSIMCPEGVVLLPQGRRDIFEVTETGHILATTNPQFPFMKGLLDLGTTDRLSERLRQLDMPR